MKNKKKKRKIDIKTILLIITMVFSCVNLYAIKKYLYNSNDVRYDNKNTSLLTSATDVQTAIDDLYKAAATYDVTAGNSGFHNSIFRGKDVTEYLTSEYSLYNRISDGTFTDLYVGDYIVANGITWRIAGFDIYYGRGDSNSENKARTTHHAVIVPDTNLTKAQMNSTNTTTGGYIGSTMFKTTLTSVLSTYITPVFGSHVLTYRTFLTNTITTTLYNRLGKNTGASSNWTAYTRSLDLMTENQVFGSIVASSSMYDTGIDNIQFPLFRLKPEYVNKIGGWYWLRGVVSSYWFTIVGDSGSSYYAAASYTGGVRPYFYID